MKFQTGDPIVRMLTKTGWQAIRTLQDLVNFLLVVPKRRSTLEKLPVRWIEEPFINILSKKMHPPVQHLLVEDIINLSPTTRTYRLKANKAKGTQAPACFRAGQYVSIKEKVKDHTIARPYSIASSPADALEGFYDITIKRLEGGFLTTHIWESWKMGTPVTASGPYGFMCHEPLRDSQTVVALAGGSGITPFRSMAREMAAGKLDIKMKLIYGCSDANDIIFIDELDAYAKQMPDRFQIAYVFSCDKLPKDIVAHIEKGFITAEIIAKYSDPSKDSYFICGPAVMYDFVIAELEKLGVPRKRIRHEAYGEVKDPARFKDYPRAAQGKTFTVTVHNGKDIVKIPALASESVLTALERAKLAPPSACRSGECQVCRSRLLGGEVWVSPKSDGRRQADRMFGYIHPCASFPISDLEMMLPVKSVGQ